MWTTAGVHVVDCGFEFEFEFEVWKQLEANSFQLMMQRRIDAVFTQATQTIA